MDRTALEERYAAALREALDELDPSHAALPAWLRPRLPASIAQSMLVAEAIAGELPESLAAHYLDRSPREWVKQRAGKLDAALRLLRAPIDAARVPGFCAAIDGACARMRALKIDPRTVLGAASAGELLEKKPCALQLISEACLASGLPLLGAGEAERGQLLRKLAAEKSGTEDAQLALLDLHLGQHLAHELLHGRAPRQIAAGERPPADPSDPYELHPADPSNPYELPCLDHTDSYEQGSRDHADAYDLAGPPWLIREAAALWLQSRAHPRHVFPDSIGEAIPGVSLFVLIGEGLAAALGADKLLSVLSEPSRFLDHFGARAATLATIAEWQLWLVRKSAPFAQDALRAVSWIKLVAAAALLDRIDRQPFDRSAKTSDHVLAKRSDHLVAKDCDHAVVNASDQPLAAAPELPPALAHLRSLSDQAASLGLVRAVRELPSLLDAAEPIPWSALDGWNREPSIEDEERARIAVRALFQENAMAPIFVTRPAPLPAQHGEPLWLETDSCLLHTAPRPQGVFAEPAHWIFPPPFCRLLRARGLSRLELRSARRADIDAIAEALIAMARSSGRLPATLSLTARELLDDKEGRWTSSPR